MNGRIVFWRKPKINSVWYEKKGWICRRRYGESINVATTKKKERNEAKFFYGRQGPAKELILQRTGANQLHLVGELASWRVGGFHFSKNRKGALSGES